MNKRQRKKRKDRIRRDLEKSIDAKSLKIDFIFNLKEYRKDGPSIAK